MERRRLRALAEAHAALQFQRAWQGFRGRSAARRRIATIAFARTAAEDFADPAAFAIENLRAFNAYGGFLGSAGIDARSLLAAATGEGNDQGSGPAAATGTGDQGSGSAVVFQAATEKSTCRADCGSGSCCPSALSTGSCCVGRWDGDAGRGGGGGRGRGRGKSVREVTIMARLSG